MQQFLYNRKFASSLGPEAKLVESKPSDWSLKYNWSKSLVFKQLGNIPLFLPGMTLTKWKCF